MKNLFLLLVLLLSASTYGQESTKYTDVLMITNNNDTVYGKTKTRFLNAPFFYKLKLLDKNNQWTTYKPFSIKSFTLGGHTFESVSLADPTCSTCTDYLFLTPTIHGPMNLYAFEKSKVTLSLLSRSGVKSKCVGYYYIRKKNDSQALLAYKEMCEDRLFDLISQAGNYDRFCAYFSDYPELMRKIKDKTYKRQDIVAIVEEYNSHFQ